MNEAIYTPPPVTGYRKLTQGEVDLMNEIKAKGDEVGALVAKLRALSQPPKDADAAQVRQLDGRCISIGATEIQTGLMWLVRAVAQPTNF